MTGFLASLPPESAEEFRLREISGLRRAQFAVYSHPARFRVLVAGRRFGKTELAVAELLRAAQTGIGRTVAYIAPSLKQAKRLIWRRLKTAIPAEAIRVKNETDLTIELKGYGSQIIVAGADNPDSLRGLGLDFVIFDEYADIRPDVWPEIVRPALAAQQPPGEALFLGTPKALNHFYDLLVQAGDPMSSHEWATFHCTTLDGENVPPEEIEAAKRTMSEHQFAQEFLADFRNPTGRVYSNFARAENVRPCEDHGGPLLIGIDFNVATMPAVIGQRVGDSLEILDEIEIINAHTQMMADEIQRRYKGRIIRAYPDPSGRQRKTSGGGETDFSILRKAGLHVLAPNRTPALEDRINTLQAMFKSASGTRRLFIDPKCKNLIRCLDAFSWGEGGKYRKRDGFDHFPDALGYLTFSEFPIVSRRYGMVKLYGT